MGKKLARNLAPGLSLLRSSRMFSLPTCAIKSPSAETYFETTTQPHPSYQSVTTFEKSRQRGDWGLKRPLPKKTTTKSRQPYLRIKKIDTIESITEFSSATDHTISVRKWAEMAIPLKVPPPENQSVANKIAPSVFEDDSDATVLSTRRLRSFKPENARWRFRGPYLNSMSEGRFQQWLDAHVVPRRAKFRHFIKEDLARQRTLDQRIARQSAGNYRDDDAPVDPSSISSAELFAYMRDLRENRHRLYDLVTKFFDLPPVPPPPTASASSSSTPRYLAQFKVGEPTSITSPNPYSRYGPPRTHPSAGMYYTRSNNYTPNHPFYGPQSGLPPVLANAIHAKHPYFQGAVLGVGGFAVEIFYENVYKHSSNANKETRKLNMVDPDATELPKYWVVPLSAHVTQGGRLWIPYSLQANQDAVNIAREGIGEKKMTDIVGQNKTSDLLLPRSTGYATISGSSSAYGIGM